MWNQHLGCTFSPGENTCLECIWEILGHACLRHYIWVSPPPGVLHSDQKKRPDSHFQISWIDVVNVWKVLVYIRGSKQVVRWPNLTHQPFLAGPFVNLEIHWNTWVNCVRLALRYIYMFELSVACLRKLRTLGLLNIWNTHHRLSRNEPNWTWILQEITYGTFECKMW